MNKLRIQTPFPNGTVAMKTLAAQIIYPRVYSQIRSEKSRSIRNTQRAAFEHGRHSQREKDMLQTHYIERPALPSQHSRNEKYTIDKIILQPRPRQVEHSRNEK